MYVAPVSLFLSSFFHFTYFCTDVILRTTSTLSALLINAALLSIDCTAPRIPGTVIRKVWLDALSPAPASLAPLPLQTAVVHPAYNNLIPIPALRERLLLAQNVIDGMIPDLKLPGILSLVPTAV